MENLYLCLLIKAQLDVHSVIQRPSIKIAIYNGKKINKQRCHLAIKCQKTNSVYCLCLDESSLSEQFILKMKMGFPLDSLLGFYYYFYWSYGLYLIIYFNYILEDRSLFCILRHRSVYKVRQYQPNFKTAGLMKCFSVYKKMFP